MIRKPNETPIEEIHRIRREISDRFGGDIEAIAEDAARRQAASERPLWKPKHDEPSDAPEVATTSSQVEQSLARPR